MTEPKTELQRNEILRQRKLELDTFQRALDRQWINNRMQDSRMGRTLALIRQEAAMEKDFQERTDHAAFVNERAEKEARLATEIAKVRDEETIKVLKRHLLWDRNPELKELVTKMTAGYVCRDLKQQIQQNEYRRIQERNEMLQISEVIGNCLLNNKEDFEEDIRHRKETAKKIREGLDFQMELLKQKRQQDLEEQRRDKMAVDRIVEKIKEEDRRALEDKNRARDNLRKEMDRAFAERKEYEKRMAREAEEQEREVQRQAQQVTDRTTAGLEARARKIREREEINKRITEKTLAEEAEVTRRREILKMLQEQEYLEKNIQDDIAETTNTEKIKKDTRESLLAQMEKHKRMAEEEKKMDVERRKKAEAIIGEADKKELEKELKKKEKIDQYRMELKKQIADNEKRRQAEKEMEERRNRSVFDFYEEMDRETLVERNKLMEEHAPFLLGHLQAGVLEKADLPHIRKGANKHPELAKLEIEKLGMNDKPRPRPKCNAQCLVIKRW